MADSARSTVTDSRWQTLWRRHRSWFDDSLRAIDPSGALKLSTEEVEWARTEIAGRTPRLPSVDELDRLSKQEQTELFRRTADRVLDAALVKRVQQDDADAIPLLWARKVGFVRWYVRALADLARRSPDSHDPAIPSVDEVVDEVFVESFRALHSLDDPYALTAWLKTIANRTFQRELRRNRRRLTLESDRGEPGMHEENVAGTIDREEESEIVRQAISRLREQDPKAWFVVDAYVANDCSWGSGEKKACAETLECDPRWVSKLLSKGMRLLRTHIRDLRDERRVR